jgi:hypothetical protein
MANEKMSHPVQRERKRRSEGHAKATRCPQVKPLGKSDSFTGIRKKSLGGVLKASQEVMDCIKVDPFTMG